MKHMTAEERARLEAVARRDAAARKRADATSVRAAERRRQEEEREALARENERARAYRHHQEEQEALARQRKRSDVKEEVTHPHGLAAGPALAECPSAGGAHAAAGSPGAPSRPRRGAGGARGQVSPTLSSGRENVASTTERRDCRAADMAKQRALEAARKEADRKATVLFRQQCAAERREEKRQERERLAEERCGT